MKIDTYEKKYFHSIVFFQSKLHNGSKDGKYMDIFKPASMATLDSLLQCSLGYKGNVQLVGYVYKNNKLAVQSFFHCVNAILRFMFFSLCECYFWLLCFILCVNAILGFYVFS